MLFIENNTFDAEIKDFVTVFYEENWIKRDKIADGNSDWICLREKKCKTVKLETYLSNS